VRLCAVDERGSALATLERLNVARPGPPYPHFDVDGLWLWLIDGLRTLVLDFDIEAIVPVTHGACAALVDARNLVLPVMDYEFDGVSELDSEYDAAARDFARTASPKLPAGLNLGRQLFWQQRRFPDEFSNVMILPYPQYWAWRLSGVPAYEPTSLGCHTDLWVPSTGDFSRFARSMNWDARFGRRVSAYTRLGSPLPSVQTATGLPRECSVLAGIHDSNASYLAHLATRDAPFSVVSTGTWVVIMTHGGTLQSLREERDMLANVDVFGNPVPTARFMGGREYAALAGEDGLLVAPSVEDLAAVVDAGALAVPAFTSQGGPFRDTRGRIEGSAGAPRARAALASLYCALMTDFCLDMLDARGDIILEGRLASNPAFSSALAALRDQPVLRSSDVTGTLRGAAMLSALARSTPLEPPPLARCRPAHVNLASTRERWRRLLPGDR
jgi:L-fuculokinase